MATTVNQRPVNSSSAATGEKPSFLLFGGLALIGLLKDTLDLIGIGSLPVLGTGITLCFSFFSFMLLLLFDRSGGRGNKRMAQGMVVTLGTLVEGIGFVINFLPLQTLTVVFLYLISYKSWKSAQQAAAVDSRRQRGRLQTQQARMARAMALREERMRGEAVAVRDMASAEPSNNTQARAVSAPRLTNTSQRVARPVTAAGSVETSRSTVQSRSPQPSSVTNREVLPSQKPTSVPTPSRLVTSDARKEIAGLRSAQGSARRNEFTRVDTRPIDASVRIREAASRLSQSDGSRKA